jgi:hypothetical protein
MKADELASWVCDVVHGGATRLDRLALGRSRVTYSAHTAVAGSYIVRVDTGEGPMSGTELTLRREAAVYAALQDRGVPIPAFHGVAPDGMALLLERVGGTSDVTALSPATLDDLYNDYIDRIADLHLVDVSGLDLPGLARPADAADATRARARPLGARVPRSHHTRLAGARSGLPHAAQALSHRDRAHGPVPRRRRSEELHA